MQRSQSVPAFALAPPASGSALAKTASLVDVRQKLKHRPRHAHTLPGAGACSPPHTPRAERNDPFSLGGFFPAAAKADGDWAWLHPEEVDAEEAAAAHALFAVPEEDGEEEGLRGKVTKVIEGEDKLGVLAIHLDRLLVTRSTSGRDDEAAPSPPLTPEEPEDDEALLRALYARRLAYTRSTKGVAPSADAPSVLFSPTDDEEADPGWLDSMRRVMRMM